MIARFLALPLLELRSVHRRSLHVVMFAVFGLMSLGFVLGGVQVSTGSADTGGAKLAINSAFNLAFADFLLFGLILPFFVAVLFGMPLLSDADRRVDRLIHATPISHVGYAFSRFAASVAVLAAILGAWLVVQVALYELVPLDPNEKVRGPFAAWHYLQPLLVAVLPAAVFVGGVSGWLGVRTRQPVLVFALPVVLVVGSLFFVWNFKPMWLPSWVDELLKLADPAGLRWVLRNFVEEDRGVAFYNTAAFAPDAPFLASRFAFVAVGLLAVWATGRRLARKGAYFAPAVLTQVDHRMQIMREESFGPVIGIQQVGGDAEAVELMNDTDYGLTAGVYTPDRARAEKILAQVNSGSVYWNCCDRVSPRLPWAGTGHSGIGVTLSTYGIQTFTRTKAWHLRGA